jgi:alkanesulfonate monooxygenase SsuD/methylene tetrahydromethanopterin reductase-like flavin-dependent oxidoreductase (luciferase family)
MTAQPRFGFWVPLFDELADPRVAARLAAEAEDVGWDGFFVWDNLTWAAPVERVADPWISLAAAAVATESVRLGPMVTPVARRRPTKLARETASLDQLADGRLTFGVGLGDDLFGGEFVSTGEQVNAPIRAKMLDETLEILTAAWSGQPVCHRGEHYVIDDLTFLPTPVQPRVPIWVGGYAGRVNPMRRAARFDGYFPIGVRDAGQLAEIHESVRALRDDPAAPYDLVVPLRPGDDPAPYAAAGATWCLTEIKPDGLTLDHVRGVVRDGPAIPAGG